MKKTSLILLSLIFALSACNNKQYPLLWEISGNGLSRPSYLFGTSHDPVEMIDLKEFLNNIHGFNKAFSSVDLLLPETDYKTAASGIAKALGPATLPSNVTYRDLLDRDIYNLLDTISVEYLGIRADELKQSPNYLALEMFYKIGERSEKKDTVQTKQYVLDYFLIELAQKKNIEIVGLDSESIRGKMFIDILSLMGMDVSELLPESTANLIKTFSLFKGIDTSFIYSPKFIELDNSRKLTEEKMKQTYFKERNLLSSLKLKKKQTKIIFEMSKSYPFNNFHQNLLSNVDFMMHERNEEWMKKIPDIISNQSAFIAVGAAHLLDFEKKPGLINRLKKLGYTVTPITK